MKKKLLRIAIVLVVLMVVAVLVLGSMLNKAVITGVETAGPMITKVDVELADADLSLLSGTGDLHGLRLGNPDGYTTPSAMEVGSASLSVQPGSLLSDKIVVRHLRLDAPVITFEGGLKGNNLNDIVKNVREELPDASEEPEDEALTRKFQVDEFVVTGAKVNVKIKDLDVTTKTLDLPEIRITDLGQGPDGITAGELTKRLLNAIYLATLRAVAESGGGLKEVAVAAMEDLKDAAVEKLKETIDTGTEKAVRGMLDLLKKEGEQ